MKMGDYRRFEKPVQNMIEIHREGHQRIDKTELPVLRQQKIEKSRSASPVPEDKKRRFDRTIIHRFAAYQIFGTDERRQKQRRNP